MLFALGLGAVLYWLALTASHDGDWLTLQARLPIVTRSQDTHGEFYHIDNLRDFRYHADGSLASSRYFAEQYYPADLRQVWLGVSHFGGHGFAHTFLSFEFAEQQYLVVSVEARLKNGQSYNPFLGLVRQYNKLMVLGTEADIIGLRSHIRAERVLLYPLKFDAKQASYLLAAIMNDVSALSEQPAFYNTLLDNCATNLLKHAPDYHFYTTLIDYRLMLPGYSDAVIRDRGWLPEAESLASLRQRAEVVVGNIALESEDFSLAIRKGWHIVEDQLESDRGVSPNK